MNYIQQLIDSQDNIIIICDKNFNIKNVNKIYYNFFRENRLAEIIKLVQNNKFDEEYKIKIKNYKSYKYTFLIKLRKIEDDISINMINITKVSAYKNSLLQSNFNFLEYQSIINKFLIISKTNLNGVITDVNDNFLKISGYSKNELIGKPHNIIRHPNMPSYVFRKMWKVIQSGNTWEGVIQNITKEGVSYYVKTLIAPLLNGKGKIKEFIALRVDISELIKAKEKAQKEKKAKEMFLANMSHEIRTPLTGIMGFIDLLKKKELPKEIENIIDIVDNSADTLLNVVNDILELSKIETEGVTIHQHKFNAKNSFENTIKLFIAKAKEKNIKYSYNVDINSCIFSDEHRLKQVLSNLIGNAIKFIPESGEVKVDIQSHKKDGQVIIDFSVEDTGIGIPKDKQDRLFKPYSQIDSESFGGTGLGLYISSQIVSKLGGKLEVESEENKGTTFYFRLKFEECEKLEKEKEEEIFVKGKILIAEDNKVNQELLRALLEIKGNLKINIVENGKLAVELFKKEKFDLVLLDIFMPIMKGVEATKKILEYEKENNLKHTPIVALTANALNGDREKFLKNGFDDYIAKPLKNEELDRVLSKYLKIDSLFILSKTLKLDDNIINNLFKIYFENIWKDLKVLKYSIEKKDLDGIRKSAHKIVGGSLAVRFDRVSEIAKNIEISAKNEEEINYLELFDQLFNIIQEYQKDVDQ